MKTLTKLTLILVFLLIGFTNLNAQSDVNSDTLEYMSVSIGPKGLAKYFIFNVDTPKGFEDVKQKDRYAEGFNSPMIVLSLFTSKGWQLLFVRENIPTTGVTTYYLKRKLIK